MGICLEVRLGGGAEMCEGLSEPEYTTPEPDPEEDRGPFSMEYCADGDQLSIIIRGSGRDPDFITRLTR